ncbi:hypothetical protein GDO86_017749 [Hymenochirus boettgeri]|uniref:Olfactory receptor n=1 Tax=Hymenochirus boettgeri TaxID=247094 RepID=A0A8T2IR86_9PIPI|nr:hypothetical protein GDO86_017749 [Hymenochirus boettgeri]
MDNQTTPDILVLSGFSDSPGLQLPFFLVILILYLMTLAVNFLITVLIYTDTHLHTPMFFFLGTLACLDTCYSSVTTPQILFDLPKQRRVISLQDCITQIYFFIGFASSEVALLAVMSYDRYIAICRPLHYMQIMCWKTCVLLITGAFLGGMMNSLLHTLSLLKLTFCRSKPLQSFFCDLPQLLQISCSDTFINVFLILFCGSLYGGGILSLTFYPYIIILNTIMKIRSKHMRSKAFSTCSSHITVIFIFYGTLFFTYFRPNTKYNFAEDKVSFIFYSVLTPLLNPLIYSLRNQELKVSLKKYLIKLSIPIKKY